MELVDRKSLPPAKSRPSRAGRALKKFPHRSEIMVIVLFKGEKGFFPGTPSEGKTKAREPSSCPRARSMNPMVSKMPGGHREVAAIAPQPRRGAPFVARRAGNLPGCAYPHCARAPSACCALRTACTAFLRPVARMPATGGPWLAGGFRSATLATCARSLPVPLDAISSLGGTLLSRIPEMNQECPR